MHNNDDDNKNNSTESKGKEKEKQAFAVEGISTKSFSDESPASRGNQTFRVIG